MAEIEQIKSVVGLLAAWQKEQDAYTAQVDEAQRKGLSFDCMQGMADGIKQCRKQLAFAVTTRVGCQFAVGDMVEKTGGDYTFEGVVTAVFAKTCGQVRLVVEDDRGLLHIYSEKNLQRKSLPFERNKALIEAER